MNRLNVIQLLIDHIGAKSYLEIGVNKGDVFLNLQVKNKIAVDPNFKFPKSLRVRRIGWLKPLMGSSAETYYECTSDKYFESFSHKHGKIDLAFIDGLHTFKQAYKDVENCLSVLSPGGYIVMHDTNPMSKAAEFPVENSINELTELASKGMIPGWNSCWNGDVWKSVVKARTELSNIRVYTIDLDFGLTVITKSEENTQPVELGISNIESLSYEDLEANRSTFLNLITPQEFLKSLGQT